DELEDAGDSRAWQDEPYEEVASVVTDERIKGRLPKIEDEPRHASGVVDIDAEEAYEEVVETEDVEATIVELPYGTPGAPAEPAGRNGHDSPKKRKRRRRRRGGKPGGGDAQGGERTS